MVVPADDGLVRRLAAPQNGWYRVTVGVGLWAITASNAHRAQLDVAANPATDTGPGVVAASVARAGIGQASANLLTGTHTLDLPLRAHDYVAAALTLSTSAGSWADSTKTAALPYVSFLELHWAGEL